MGLYKVNLKREISHNDDESLGMNTAHTDGLTGLARNTHELYYFAGKGFRPHAYCRQCGSLWFEPLQQVLAKKLAQLADRFPDRLFC